MEPISTADNPLSWRLWHSINYMIGGVCFFIGSISLFPHLNHIYPAAYVSGWSYTLGSFTFLLADIT